jgi:hypothetical protein
MEKTASLVACSKSKSDSREIAWKLYESPYFENLWAAASLVGDPYVMSAKHGLVKPTERLDPYDETLKNYSAEQKKEWGEEVLSSIPDHYDTVVLFGGRDYVNPIKEANESSGEPYQIDDPFAETSGNGEQMAVASEIAENTMEQL